MRLILAIIIGKSIAYLTKLLRIGGGSAAPGLYALKIEPDLVRKLTAYIPLNIVITGTNGKTTTAKMLAHFAKKSGLQVIRNHTGSNLERGITSTLITSVHLGGGFISTPRELPYDLGIWELDEAAFNIVTPKLKPDIIVFLNVFRDQLDRYGEIDTVVKNWCQTLQKLDSKTTILVNGDDANTAKLAKCFKGSVQKFGMEDYKITGESIKQLKEKESLDFEAKNIRLSGLVGSKFSLIINRKSLIINLPLPGLYHIYDFLAAFAIGKNLNLPPKQMVISVKDYSPAFGRVEKLPFGYIFLIKNPAGATQVFETIAPNIKPDDRLLLALNDNLADGTDVSWIWDAEFEKILHSHTHKLKVKSRGVNTIPPPRWIYVSGNRAHDLAVRLKYAGFNPEQFIIDSSLEKALKEARNGLEGRLFILPTYTAMLELQSILVKSGIKKQYWKEE